jgi:hypothetical protein
MKLVSKRNIARTQNLLEQEKISLKMIFEQIFLLQSPYFLFRGHKISKYSDNFLILGTDFWKLLNKM